jgi:uncharacterized protein (DUF1697 family)
LLRAVNLGSYGKVAMPDLLDLLARLGFRGARSMLQTGNLVFHGDDRPSDEIERLLEAEAAKQLRLQTDFFVRSLDEWGEVVVGNPFPDAAKRDPSHLLVVFLKSAPQTTAVTALQAAIAGPEIVRAEGRQLYITYPDGIGRSKLTSTVIERKLGTRGTGRNWNTVLKLQELGSAPP